MIICIDCSVKAKDELDELIRIGGYRDYSEAISLAVSNQLLLHRDVNRSVGPAQKAANKTATPVAAIPAAQSPRREKSGKSAPREAKRIELAGSGTDDQTSVSVGSIPELFRNRSTGGPIDVAPFPNDAFTPGQRITIDRWIFGQHNKLLPLVAAIRGLGNLVLRENGPVSLTKCATEIALSGEILGTYLRTMDKKLELVREESLSTAFPNPDTDINKSRLRYANQFVGALNKRGQLRGFPMDLKLLNFRNHKDPKLLLTEAGWYVHSLENPVLDKDANTGEKLSQQERDFFISHIQKHVPVEDFAIRAVLEALEGGAQSPDEVDEVLKKYMPDRSDEPFSPAFVATQRSGVISRMTDLGLVVRERDGLRVAYMVSQSGKKYLQCTKVA